MDAVYALAHALHNMLVARCGRVELCRAAQLAPDGQQLLRHIRNVSFIGERTSRAVVRGVNLSRKKDVLN